MTTSQIPLLDDGTYRTAIRRVGIRLIPLLILVYVIAWLDRVNVSFAALQMNRDLGFGPAIYGFGAGVFFLSYAALEVPSNMLLARVGARRWIARIMISWGVAATAMVFISGPTSFYIARLLLGAAEAGCYPGILYYLGLWYPRADRGRALSWFAIAVPLGSLFGGPCAGVLLSLDGRLGIAGWQWVFAMEGLPAVIIGLVVLRYLPDSPKEAKWLTPDERACLLNKITEERASTDSQHLGAWQVLRNGTAICDGLNRPEFR